MSDESAHIPKLTRIHLQLGQYPVLSDIMRERMRQAEPDDWLFALVSLQTQEGFLGAGNYGISRMNGGFSSRPALGVAPHGGAGRRWRRDVAALLATRDEVAEVHGLQADGGLKLLWLAPWDGTTSTAFAPSVMITTPAPRDCSSSAWS